ncbi:substrate-binding domain-containing protein, partial [Sphingobacterium lactis]
IYCSMDNDETKAKELIQLFYDRQVDGYIITPPEGLEDTLSNLIKNNVPLVLFDRYIPSLETHYVVLDNFNGAFDATKHLLENPNNKRVGFVSLYSNQTQMRDRLEGYMKAIDDYQYQAFIKKIKIDEDEELAIEQLHEFISSNNLDAVLFATNYLAIKGLMAVKKYNMDLPHMVAFDDHTLFSLYEPGISVVTQDTSAIANELIHTLLNEIKGKNKELQQIVIPSELLVRGSSAIAESLEQTS